MIDIILPHGVYRFLCLEMATEVEEKYREGIASSCALENLDKEVRFYPGDGLEVRREETEEVPKSVAEEVVEKLLRLLHNCHHIAITPSVGSLWVGIHMNLGHMEQREWVSGRVRHESNVPETAEMLLEALLDAEEAFEQAKKVKDD